MSLYLNPKPEVQPSDDLTLFTVKEVAEQLKLHISTVYQYLDTGELKAHRFGKALRIARQDLAEFIKAHR